MTIGPHSARSSTVDLMTTELRRVGPGSTWALDYIDPWGDYELVTWDMGHVELIGGRRWVVVDH